MNKKDFKYILRFALSPGFREDERLDRLASFCREALIDNVTIFINAEDLNTGHLTVQETYKWMDMVVRIKERLKPQGITISINPWITLFQIDRGRTLKEGQNFKLMVDPYGTKASAQVCPICLEWRKYIAQIFSIYASASPEVIWVDDDMRLQNHPPLQWGGCFCDEHMERFSEKAGKKLNREEFFKAVIQPGEPHPYRKLWLEAAKEDIVDVCKLLGRAVHEISPSTRVGLMSDDAGVFCAEGRNWNGILEGLACGQTMVSRPHLGSYCEISPQAYLWSFSTSTRFSRAVLPEAAEVYPELENFTYTRFFKSKSFTQFQLETSFFLDLDGITINIFDFTGNGILMNEGYQVDLARSKDFAGRVQELELKQKYQLGIKVLCSTEASYEIHTTMGEGLDELYPKELFWAGLLSAFGVPNRISLEKKHKGCVVAVSGQYFRNLVKVELEELFTDNFVIMEGEAAHTLYEMGYGYLAGIKNALWRKVDSGYQAYEQVCNGREYCGLNEARLTTQYIAGDYLEIEYLSQPFEMTEVRSPNGNRLGSGVVVLEDKVMILPYGHFMWWLQTHLNSVRQAIIQDVVKDIKHSNCNIFVKDAPNVMACLFEKEESIILVLLNFSGDGYPVIRLHAPALSFEKVQEINRQNDSVVYARTTIEGDDVLIHSELKSMELKAFIFKG